MSEQENKKSFRAIISGIVQGVGFRYFTYRRAVALGLTGYVRNLADGRVEVVAEGEEENLRQLLKELKVGPSYASVENVEVEWGMFTGQYSQFEIKLDYGY